MSLRYLKELGMLVARTNEDHPDVAVMALIVSQGVLIRAVNKGLYQKEYIVAWDMIGLANVNPLLVALDTVMKAIKA